MTRIARQSLSIVTVISLVAVGFRAPRAEKRDTDMSSEALSVTFESAIRNLVINWDPTDPQTANERLKSLSTFMYETYDASACIPQSLFDSNVITQAVVGDVETIIREKVGLVEESTDLLDREIIDGDQVSGNLGHAIRWFKQRLRPMPLLTGPKDTAPPWVSIPVRDGGPQPSEDSVGSREAGSKRVRARAPWVGSFYG